MSSRVAMVPARRKSPVPEAVKEAVRPRGSNGVIRPPKWSTWFDSYTSVLIHFAWIAEQNHVDVLSVGSELVSSEKERSEWSRCISKVREVFHGQLTYSANWDHYRSKALFALVDEGGASRYFNLREPTAHAGDATPEKG